MEELKLDINAQTTIAEAIKILKQKADIISESEEAQNFYKQNNTWSKLFKDTYKPYADAVKQYEEALEINQWLNNSGSENSNLTLTEIFNSMPNQQKLSLFHKRINTDTPSIFDKQLQAWWMSRY